MAYVAMASAGIQTDWYTLKQRALQLGHGTCLMHVYAHAYPHVYTHAYAHVSASGSIQKHIGAMHD